MAVLTFLALSGLLFMATSTRCHQHYKYEAQNIMKRMSEVEAGFEGHDVATIHLVDGQGQSRLTRRDLQQFGNEVTHHALRLDMSSGSRVNLAVRSSGVVNADTSVSYRTPAGRFEGKRGVQDCFSYGNAADSSGEGVTAVSRCDGLFGFASTPGYDYFFHPVGSSTSKREVSRESEYDVHVLWRRSTAKSGSNNNATGETSNAEDLYVVSDESSQHIRSVVSNRRRDASDVVIEMAMFSDEQYWRRLQKFYPGREDDFLLTRLAGTQALFGNRDKVGYDVKIKLKLLEYWTTNPPEYVFAEKLGYNMKSFCEYTTESYFYDVHVLNTGVVEQTNGVVGLAYVRGMCTRVRCFSSLAIRFDSFVVYAHELGHTMGIAHPSAAKCPKELQSEAGFMGGGEPFNFSPCMRYLFAQFLDTPKSSCLFEETAHTVTPPDYSDLPKVFPGQMRTPDGLCQALAGPEYTYVPFGKYLGKPVCQWVLCLNENKNSPSYGRAQRFFAPIGFPCDEESFCAGNLCRPWSQIKMIMSVDDLRKMRHTPQWSEWSTEFSDCSRSCGTGVKTRRRVCQMTGFNLSPYCPGSSVRGILCNTDPCPGDSTEPGQLWQIRADELCSRFLKDKVQLQLANGRSYLSKAGFVSTEEAGANLAKAHSKSCLLKCQRDPAGALASLDAVVPDGTPCFDTDRHRKDLLRFDIQLRCVRGFCTEFSNCPEVSQRKDACGVCGGDGSGCKKRRDDLAVPSGDSIEDDVNISSEISGNETRSNLMNKFD